MKIMIVDDMEPVINAMKQKFNGTEHNVVAEITDPSELDIKIQENNPDAILMDVNMGTYNGIVLIGELKDKYPLLKIVIMSADACNSYMALNKGADGFVSKMERKEKVLKVFDDIPEDEKA